MEFTGERYIPKEKGRIRLEHYHRYAMVLGLVSDRDVLDAGCGEGYGTSLISDHARRAVGVDISEEAVRHAIATYGTKKNLEFIRGDVARLDLPDSSFDVVVSFETLEHLAEQAEMVAELRRVLRPDGILIISTPNRLVYSKIKEWSNIYHVKELDLTEFDNLLKSQFSAVRYFGQRLNIGSAIRPLDNSQPSFLAWKDDGIEICAGSGLPTDPMYYIAVCAADESMLPKVDASILHASDDELEKLLDELNRALVSRDKSIGEFRESLDNAKRHAANLEYEVEQFRKRVTGLEDETKQLKTRIAGLYIYLRNHEKFIRGMIRSNPWKITAPFRWIDSIFYRISGRDKYEDDAKLILDSQLFDEKWYLEQYEDVAASGIDPSFHYLRFGATEGRNPGPFFDSDWYLAEYKDVASTGINPLVHYLKFGVAENRRPSPMFPERG